MRIPEYNTNRKGFARHPVSGEVFVLQYEGDEITACHGPLYYGDVTQQALEDGFDDALTDSDSIEDAEWAIGQGLVPHIVLAQC